MFESVHTIQVFDTET